jgi:cystathionine gamma-synthase
LALRFAAACANAQTIAERLATHPGVVDVRYPGLSTDPGHAVASRQMATFGAVIAFRPAGGTERAEAVTRATHLWLHATSLGGVESTLERRRRHREESPRTPDDLIRLSVGCEDVEDLWTDLAEALQ